eukprot:SAG22_NODE_9609_length_579_cov_1.402083_1_plen_93_part_10
MQHYFDEEWIFVRADVRGRYGSEGTFVQMTPHIDNKQSDADIDESSDTYDMIEWLVTNIPNNNGRVGIMGIRWVRGSSQTPPLGRCPHGEPPR